MNLKDKKMAFVASLLVSIFLSGCGLKGDLYQTPEVVSGEGIIGEDVEKNSPKQLPSNTQPEENPPLPATNKQKTLPSDQADN